MPLRDNPVAESCCDWDDSGGLRGVRWRQGCLCIGEFSRITGLTIKTLRFYHELGLLLPTHVDEQTGYRYYAQPGEKWQDLGCFW